MRVPAALAAPWSSSRVFNCRVHEMSLRIEEVVFAARISPVVT